VPSKQVSPRYLRNVNVANTTITNNAFITNVYNNRVRDIQYVNRNVPGAITTAPRTVFTSPRPIARPVWSGDFRNNARLEPAPTARDHGASRPSRNPESRVADSTPTPLGLGRPPVERPQDDARRTIPRPPTDRRQIQSDDGWRRIDARPNALQGVRPTPPPPTLQGAPLPRVNAQRDTRQTPVSMPARTFNRGPDRPAPAAQGNSWREAQASAPAMRSAPAHDSRPSGNSGNSRGPSLGGGRSNRGGGLSMHSQ
jgi:hypothetical protein